MNILNKIVNEEELSLLKKITTLKDKINIKNPFEEAHFDRLSNIIDGEEIDVSNICSSFDFIIKVLLTDNNFFNKINETKTDVSLLISKLESFVSYISSSSYKNVILNYGN